MAKNKVLAEQNIEKVVKWKWGATCYCKYRDGNWEIFEWSSDDIAQPTNAEIEAEIPNYQAVLDAKAIEEETAKQVKADLKASAKAKLVAGEALTEDEANTIVL
nr:hypothetical protein [uncultured Mediterranean phage uvMED]